ncbi:FkbM family methyltransferase [Actibacterium sp. MT2.3-13A]|uniref:FkbM family methyltransferase n=1 Tax=Actibacterium sp. MT2.3-13A TaxID=2828332 RepID=UPI001BAA850C|nr:FkbM family methyltransferase [Actibacterium sp. MT2.3-13A]
MPDQAYAPLPAALIILGPPAPEALEALLAEGISRVVLVEPDPDRAARLEIRFGDRPGLEVVAAAVAGQEGPAELAEFNFPGLRSLHAPSPALRSLLPGLRVRARHAVEAITPAGLLARLGDLPRPAHLRIDAPGSEAAILQGLQAEGALERFDRIWLRCGAEPMFEGARDCRSVQDWAHAQGFETAGIDASDPDWPVLSLAFDQRGHELKALRQRSAELEAQAGALTEQLHQRDAALAEAQAAAAAGAQRSADLEAQAGALTEQLHQRDAALAEAQAAAETARADLAVALRMQVLAQSDLQDLQERYRASEEARATQAELLRKLTPRLQQAAQQLQQLALAEDTAEPEALTADKPRPRSKQAPPRKRAKAEYKG